MQAMVYTAYGPPDVLQLKEAEKPRPADNEVLIKVHASSVNAAEWHVVRGDPFLVRLMVGGLLKPKRTIPGADVAGRVEAVGANVTRFRPGDEVFGDLSGCGWGAFAEYVCAPEQAVALKPAGVSFEAAAAAPMAGVTALQGLRAGGGITPGQKVLVNGAASGVGSFAVQIAKAFGAEVTAACSAGKMDVGRALGADHVLDSARLDLSGGQRYDLIFDVAAYRPFSAYRRALSPAGAYVLIGGSTGLLFRAMLLGPLVSRAGGQRIRTLMAKPDAADLGALKELIEAGSVVPLIDRCFQLREAAEALRYVETRQARGKVVLTLAAA